MSCSLKLWRTSPMFIYDTELQCSFFVIKVNLLYYHYCTCCVFGEIKLLKKKTICSTSNGIIFPPDNIIFLLTTQVHAYNDIAYSVYLIGIINISYPNTRAKYWNKLLVSDPTKILMTVLGKENALSSLYSGGYVINALITSSDTMSWEARISLLCTAAAKMRKHTGTCDCKAVKSPATRFCEIRVWKR